MILVSACLCGINCKYNGGNNAREEYIRLFNEGKVIPICPEQLGGLTTPRIPCEIEKGFSGEDVLNNKAGVFNKAGKDVTDFFIKGAIDTVKIANALGIKKAVLKGGSPSCGCGEIYNGEFSGVKKKGNGVAAAALLNAGVEVFNNV